MQTLNEQLNRMKVLSGIITENAQFITFSPEESQILQNSGFTVDNNGDHGASLLDPNRQGFNIGIIRKSNTGLQYQCVAGVNKRVSSVFNNIQDAIKYVIQNSKN